ncbi:hypothetical protein EYW49_18390 [Siculibacillus lacustris]|uniref:Uncharacterized protein n=1 Tax=Siculibacillus lacustris TaxID=1549641 RepID=A0A4Q9VIA1_9HYPH|nr:hypothetical protein [Siculibacillus lacustris]TBW34408.1 hypothetical protein EYW49_18390 [Siculibacillus lacustris]
MSLSSAFSGLRRVASRALGAVGIDFGNEEIARAEIVESFHAIRFIPTRQDDRLFLRVHVSENRCSGCYKVGLIDLEAFIIDLIAIRDRIHAGPQAPAAPPPAASTVAIGRPSGPGGRIRRDG